MIVVFDLDGTLVDSASDIGLALGRAMVGQGIQPPDLDEVRSWIGDGARTLVERALASRGVSDVAAVDVAFVAFRAAYEHDPVSMTRPYPGVVHALEALRSAGHRAAVCTNKPRGPMLSVLEGTGLAAHLCAAVGGDELPVRKPDPEPLREAIRRAGGGPALLVGDGPADRDAARAADVPFMWVGWGYGPLGAAVGARWVCREPSMLAATLSAAVHELAGA